MQRELKLMNNIQKTESSYEILKNKAKDKSFYLLHILLKHQVNRLWLQIVIISIELLQLLMFPFSSIFKSVWKNEQYFNIISSFFNNFQLVSFLKGNSLMFQLCFYVCIGITLIMIVWFIVLATLIGNKSLCSTIVLFSFRIFLFLFSTIFFLPIIQIFFSMLNCIEMDETSQVNYYDQTITCFSSFHICLLVFGIIFAIIFSFLCYIGMLSFYDFKLKTNSPLARTNIVFDRELLSVKVILSFVFNFLNQDYRWIACVILFVATSLTLYSFYNNQPHLNQTVHFFYFFMISVLEWASIVVVISIILEGNTYNGGIALFLIGIPVIIGLLVYFPIDYIALLLPHVIKFTNGGDVLQQIRRFLFLYNNIEHSRKSQILLKGYAFQFETQCSIVGCPLKKYIESTHKGKGIPSFFLQHAESLFFNAISKFPSCISLRLSYCFFLLEYLNKNRKANEELLNIKRFALNNEQQFIIFHYQKLIEEHMFDLIEDDPKIDTISNLAYKNCFYQFKQTIAHVTFHYIDFWTLLLNPNQDQEQLKILSDYGTKIISKTADIQKLFDKLQKINSRDVEVIYYYSNFLSDILNKTKEANEFKAKLKDIEDTKNFVDDTIFFSLDINTLSSSDEYQFIALSGLREKFGIITHISLGVCLLLGYAKNEIIGKYYDLFMPEIFIRHHHQLLLDKVNEFKKETVNESFDDHRYKPKFKPVNSFAKTKARYLVKIEMKVALIVTETQRIAFIAKVNKDFNALSMDTSECNILTNNNLIIQNFTVNSVNMLGMNSLSMNNSVDITKLIKQFHEEYLKTAIDNEDMTSEQKIAMKRQIINKKFRFPSTVNWKQSDFSEYQVSPKIKESLLQNSFNMNKFTLRENKIILSVHDAVIGGIQEGYIFKFMKAKASITSNQFNMQSFDNSNISNSQYGSNLLQLTQMLPDYNTMKTFIPTFKTDFQLNLKNMSYVRNPKYINKFRDEIKDKAIQKLQSQDDMQEKRTSNNNDDSYLSSIDESENNNKSSMSSGNSSKVDSLREVNFHSENTNNVKNNNQALSSNSNQDYYKVCFSNIKYSIYSFEKKTVLEVVNFQKKSQVEMKLNDDKELAPLEAKQSSQVESIKEDSKKKGLDKEKILIKQIEYALVNGDAQPTITRLKWISICIVLYLLCFGGGWLGLIFLTGEQLKEGVNLIQNNYKLLINALSNHISIRELTLLDQRNYNQTFFADDNILKEKLLESIKANYLESHELNLKLVTSSFPLSTQNKSLLFNSTIVISGIKEDLTLTTFNLTLSSAFFEINTGSFHIINSFKQYYPTNNYIFFYIYNVNNNISINLQSQITIYISEVLSLMSKLKIYYSLLIAFGFALTIASYFLFAFAYNGVVRRKESYLAIFFEISSQVIKNFLGKCELFTKKLQLDSLSDFINTEDTELEDPLDSTIEQSSKKTNQNAKKKINTQKAVLVKILYSIFILGVILMVGISFGYYLDSIDTLALYIKEYQGLNDIFVEYEKLYRNFNEYLFDNKSIVENTDIGTYFPNYINNFYLAIKEKDKSFENYKENFPDGFSDIYNRLNKNDMCNLLNITDLLCYSPILLNSASYGFAGINNLFIEEVRAMKNEKINKDRETSQIVKDYQYNLTLNGHPENDKLIDEANEEKYFKFSPILLFNHNSTKRIKILFDYFIKPGFLFLNNKFIESFTEYIKVKELTYILICSFYLLIIICLYLFIWKPFERNLSNIILKTKSMLLIIPKDVLASFDNIEKLLNVTLIFNKNKLVKE